MSNHIISYAIWWSNFSTCIETLTHITATNKECRKHCGKCTITSPSWPLNSTGFIGCLYVCLSQYKAQNVHCIPEEIFKDNIPTCEECSGLVKPDIVFFRENLPTRFFQLMQSDFPKCDLLLILGTSLTVQPFAMLINKWVLGGQQFSLPFYPWPLSVLFDSSLSIVKARFFQKRWKAIIACYCSLTLILVFVSISVYC